MVYGYCRVSTKQQNLERQLKNITAEDPTATIYRDMFTGTTKNRPQWQKLLKAVQTGDKIIFDSISRMSRDAEEGFNTYIELFNKGVALHFIKEPYCDTDVYMAAVKTQIQPTGEEIADIYIEATNKVLQIVARRQIQIAFDQAEKEVTDLHKRIAEGMAVAGSGKKISEARTGNSYEHRKEQIAKNIILEKSKDFNGSNSDKEVMQLIRGKLEDLVKEDIKYSAYRKPSISRNSYYKYKRDLREINA